MMSLFIIFFVALYTFMPRQPEGESIDSIKTKLSSLKKEAPVSRPQVLKKKEVIQEATETTAFIEEDRIEPQLSSEGDESMASAETQESIPWDDIEKGWESEVKETLSRLDPVDGEAMFTAYLNERENHKNEIDALFSAGGEGKDRSPSTVAEGTDEAIGALDQKHEERLKDILGSHYDEVRRRHQEYMESIQHMNREALDGEIGVSL